MVASEPKPRRAYLTDEEMRPDTKEALLER